MQSGGGSSPPCPAVAKLPPTAVLAAPDRPLKGRNKIQIAPARPDAVEMSDDELPDDDEHFDAEEDFGEEDEAYEEEDEEEYEDQDEDTYDDEDDGEEQDVDDRDEEPGWTAEIA